MTQFYSQYGQDKWLSENYYSQKNDGFFVEVGCIDGLHLSNTKHFEDKGWGGICIEPSPTYFKELKKNRNCICENIAASNYEGDAEFLDIIGYSAAISGLTEKYHPLHLKRVESELQRQDNKSNKVKVKVEPLQNVFDRHNITHVDFCTIDTEGGELEILKSIDFEKTSIDIIMVEDNYGDDSCVYYLYGKGYEMKGRLGQDLVFAKI